MQNIITQVLRVAFYAGEEILRFYGDKDFILKSDNSPLTSADLASHTYLCQELLRIVDIPICSEENELEYLKRKDLARYFLIDPLDGTKDFLAHNDEFCINIALMEKQNNQTLPILGVIYAPALHQIYFGAQGFGAYVITNLKKDFFNIDSLDMTSLLANAKKLPLDLISPDKHTALISNFHHSSHTQDFLQHYSLVPKALGASLKFCLVASGEAYIYPRFIGSKEWDSAAGDIIIQESGGIVLDVETKKPLCYNKPHIKNNHFIAFSQQALKGAIYKEFCNGRI
ncbi:3'(2'),5'-bisphosphate nucleotidase CysQ [Helicobacter fennelliae]|uniref:3'(2'),5'-bisphosphate nucleotidase CysQ family protein n=1 Tax=Helicobacter fennelliae TaxID=215 RepID=UPI000DFAB35B|nr:3'(2'),5'-bisphosphate nucleotidase CysQ [Helicobacter fennelliae]STQ83734.1 3'(2'),5'-bisphosphate nucleotidase CysQ [Helicobacter fennelliae]